ncbi:hypothetical protein E1295_17455 [Nonomuraea mesophila]|uniref:FtsX-like permease family protein n=2 Tax=Nonomuraea mesophila TaxID=2530382 RepID=A0A4R5FJ68_9ACTN|nr:hypothetical protein E1295_17455 [Nonomuraea mesophila]
MVFVAWTTREDRHYDDTGAFLLLLAAVVGGSLLLTGAGPSTPWLLALLRRHTVRLPPSIRLAARDLARNSGRTAHPIAITMVTTAVAVTVLIVAVAVTAQSRAGYDPAARSGALLVNVLAEDATDVRATIQRELPGVPVAQRDLPSRRGDLRLRAEGVRDVASSGFIGDQALLRYLTGNPATPYDEGTAVVVTPHDVQVDAVTLTYALSSGEPSEKTIPAVVVSSSDPYVNEVFIPTQVVRDLGLRPEPYELIVDPSAHRTTGSEQERIDRRMGEGASTYVERGFRGSTGWLGVVAALIVVALGSALVAGGRAAARGRSRRVLLRAGNGSALTLRRFAASRAGLSMVCGTAPGAVAGCVIGSLLAWPTTTSHEWEVMPRVSFDTPWWAIATLVAALPVLAGIIAALPRPPRG